MKNKFLALAAFGAAALGGAILSAPANAQIPQGSGPSQNVTVNVSVPEILYLRTIVDADVTIDPADLGANGLTPVPGTTPPAAIGSDQSEEAGGTVNTASPFATLVAGAPIQKTITSAYIVWSNAPSNYSVAITPGTFAGPNGNIAVAVNGANPASFAPTGLVTAPARDVVLDITLPENPTAGTYTGTLAIEAFRP
ncbi:MAG TPA: hypothetical protein VK203_07625 [Nostocaceae cyanobacterium]|nr:hypothetical protein [Nostocaceae cyanobacterium]